ncbi:MAG: TIGR02757 family protein [Deltaproteobacteria bacterium]|nr:TIGR02757 family protein [Deltaproteobacteria bacterium]NIS77497.1 TIGR02757 family protein [Deltaproteobacteria bacterium]
MKDHEEKIAHLLDSVFAKYGNSYLDTDPVGLVHRFSSEEDIEVVGFFAALLAFGNVLQIKRSIEALLEILGPHPAGFVKNFTFRKKSALDGFRHRFVGGEQVATLILSLRKVIAQRGSIKNAFVDDYAPGDMVGSLSRFIRNLRRAAGGRGDLLKFLLPDPERGSACKRLFLYLRWMVRRDDGVDFGIFDSVSPGDLVIPLDTHVARLSGLFGFTRKKIRNLSMALEITEFLRRFDPHDPVKYDFALTRIGIVEGCRGVFSVSRCRDCQAWEVCRALPAQ